MQRPATKIASAATKQPHPRCVPTTHAQSTAMKPSAASITGLAKTATGQSFQADIAADERTAEQGQRTDEGRAGIAERTCCAASHDGSDQVTHDEGMNAQHGLMSRSAWRPLPDERPA